MTAHVVNVPFAHSAVKCLLHTPSYYAWEMSVADRLKKAREQAGFATAAEAALALGVPKYTYAQHENGTRGFKKESADQYARKFKVSVEWLMFGRGPGPEPSADPSADDLEQMIREAIDGVVTVQTRLADLPRIVAPALHEQLERFRADRAAHDQRGEKPSPGKSSRSRHATSEAGKGG